MTILSRVEKIHAISIIVIIRTIAVIRLFLYSAFFEAVFLHSIFFEAVFSYFTFLDFSFWDSAFSSKYKFNIMAIHTTSTIAKIINLAIFEATILLSPN